MEVGPRLPEYLCSRQDTSTFPTELVWRCWRETALLPFSPTVLWNDAMTYLLYIANTFHIRICTCIAFMCAASQLFVIVCVSQGWIVIFVMQLGSEAFRAPEILFQPDLIGSESKGGSVTSRTAPTCMSMAVWWLLRQLWTIIYDTYGAYLHAILLLPIYT